MKKLMLILGLLVSTVSLGAGNPSLKKEITEKLILDLSEVELDRNQQDFVVVDFYICNGEINLLEIAGTQKQLVEKVKKKLSQLTIENSHDEEMIYRYKLTFEKH